MLEAWPGGQDGQNRINRWVAGGPPRPGEEGASFSASTASSEGSEPRSENRRVSSV